MLFRSKHVAIVLQDTVLFSDTVQHNLQYANENATMAQLEQAAQMSRCRDMIHALPQGYETMLEADGANISQGQIVEQGTHEELLARQGKYYALYMTQFAGFAT